MALLTPASDTRALGGGLRPPSEPPPGRSASRRTATGWAPCVRGEPSRGCAGKAGARSGTPNGPRLIVDQGAHSDRLLGDSAGRREGTSWARAVGIPADHEPPVGAPSKGAHDADRRRAGAYLGKPLTDEPEPPSGRHLL